MIESHPWLSIVPPLVAIGIAIKFRQVYIALIIGIWSGATILADGNIFTGLVNTIERCIKVFGSEDNTKIILFSAMIGAIIALSQRSGGMLGFIDLISRKKLITNRRRAQLMTVFIGAAIPIESSINVLVTGTVSRPIFDKLKISREKLAYLCDSISAPICTMVPINAWGAYLSRLLAEQNVASPYKQYLFALPFNFYPIFAIAIVFFIVISGKDFFAMGRAEKRASEEGKVLRDGATPLISADVISIEPKDNVQHRASDMIVPVVTMVLMMIASMLITGNGNIVNGNGATSVLWAVMSAIFVAGVKYRIKGLMTYNELQTYFFKGVGGLIPIALLMMFAFAIGKLCSDMKTGIYVSNVTQNLITPKIFPVLLFIVTGFIAFSTGTSWGTWGIMVPIGMGLVYGQDLNMLPIIGAIMSGGVFGDHCSPISDTTLVSSMASASDHIDHVNTQLPYALTAGALAAVFFLLTGVFMY
ncbi:Na+/H+ antiporter NhaC family protein [candidate division KSB1 bacterium]